MKKLIAVFAVLICVSLTGCATITTQQGSSLVSTTPLQGTTQSIPQGVFDNLITEPGDGMTKVLSMIQGATKSIDLVMYELEDTQIESALVLAEKRGIVVRVLLNEGYYGAQPFKESEAAYQYLQSGGVPIHWTPSYFALTHQKTLIVDGNEAIIMTFNLTSQYYSSSRDFGVVDKDQADVSAIETTFNDDWQGIKDTAPQGDDLVWSPGADAVVVLMINNSQKSLQIENEEMSDAPVVDALISADQRGVTVEVVMTNSSDWTANFTKLKAAGIGVRTYAANASLYIHAKIILADGTSALVGSQNFSASSLKNNRELAIMLSDTNILNSLSSTFQSDWNGGTPF